MRPRHIGPNDLKLIQLGRIFCSPLPRNIKVAITHALTVVVYMPFLGGASVIEAWLLFPMHLSNRACATTK
jgi:hypothetical protein